MYDRVMTKLQGNDKNTLVNRKSDPSGSSFVGKGMFVNTLVEWGWVGKMRWDQKGKNVPEKGRSQKMVLNTRGDQQQKSHFFSAIAHTKIGFKFGAQTEVFIRERALFTPGGGWNEGFKGEREKNLYRQGGMRILKIN